MLLAGLKKAEQRTPHSMSVKNRLNAMVQLCFARKPLVISSAGCFRKRRHQFTTRKHLESTSTVSSAQMHAIDYRGTRYGQTAGDCKIVVKDQHQGSAEQQPTGFHDQVNTLNRSELLPQAGAKPTECPSLPTLTIDDQQSNANAIRPNDSSAARGSNSVQSNRERPNAYAIAGSPQGGFDNSVASIASGPNIGTESPNHPLAKRILRPNTAAPANPKD